MKVESFIDRTWVSLTVSLDFSNVNFEVFIRKFAAHNILFIFGYFGLFSCHFWMQISLCAQKSLKDK